MYQPIVLPEAGMVPAEVRTMRILGAIVSVCVGISVSLLVLSRGSVVSVLEVVVCLRAQSDDLMSS